MSVKTEKTHIILVPRELTGEATDSFESEITQSIASAPAGIVLDCSSLRLVSSSHINVLWTAREKCEAASIPMRLRNVSDRLLRTLKILDLDEFFITDGVKSVEGDDDQRRPAYDADDKLFQIRLKPVNEEILRALNNFRQFLRGFKVASFCSLELETVFYEILTNIRQHGKTESDVFVEISAKASARGIELTFTDNGRAFNPSENVPDFDPEKAVSSGQRHGFGLTMIARMTDDMDYERKDDELNVLKVKKYWK